MKPFENRKYLIGCLLREGGYRNTIPPQVEEQRRLLRSLMNVRLPAPIGADFLHAQDEYLRYRAAEKGITDAETLDYRDGIAVWRGDITTLKADAIVNAANSQMLGCFVPCHGCIDNAIHTYAGVQLRAECEKIMRAQGHDEPTGSAKITKGYNLPCRYILHTVGPIISHRLTDRDRLALASCYESCLRLAEEYRLSTVAFCCISTGEFHFPNEDAARIAVATVKSFRERTGSLIRVIFNVFKAQDEKIYRELLGI